LAVDGGQKGFLLGAANKVPLAGDLKEVGEALDTSFDDETGAEVHDLESRTVEVATSPRIYTIDNFLSDEECDFMRAHGEPHLQRSLTIDRNTGEYHPDTVRTNMQMYVSKEDSRSNPTIARIVRRLHRLARVPIGHGEQIQVGRYLVGEKYECHYDSETRVNVVRPATVIVYITSGVEGGATLFPMGADCSPMAKCCHNNLTMPSRLLHPAKGRAVLFYTHDPDGSQNWNALHGSCPVDTGEKWIIQAWFRSTLYHESPHYQFQASSVDGSDPSDHEL